MRKELVGGKILNLVLYLCFSVQEQPKFEDTCTECLKWYVVDSIMKNSGNTKGKYLAKN